jgi:hypothetical protein
MLDVCPAGDVSVSLHCLPQDVKEKPPRRHGSLPDAHHDIALYNACAVRSK